MGLLVYYTFLHFLKNFWVMISLTIVGALVMGMLARKLHDHIMIYGTAFLGAYAFIRGWSLLFGKYPNEYEVYIQMEKGMSSEFTW